ncbi:MAG: hypothetical protein ACRD12_23740 [Acidimicrobiales bacterium]
MKRHRDDVDVDRSSLLEVLDQFGRRPDIMVGIAREIGEIYVELDRDPAAASTVVTQDEVRDEAPSPAPPRPDPPFVVQGPNGGPSGAKMKLSRFPAPGVDVSYLARNLVGWYESQKLDVQQYSEGGRVVVQCRSQAASRRLGAGAALTVVLSNDHDDLAVEIGGAKWSDKMIGGGVAWFLFWPAAIPAAMGGWKQATLPNKTLSYIQSMIPVCSRAA